MTVTLLLTTCTMKVILCYKNVTKEKESEREKERERERERDRNSSQQLGEHIIY